MGDEIRKSRFEASDFERFARHLNEETARLGDWFRQGPFPREAESTGFELEAWLVDANYLPAPKSDQFLNKLHHPCLVPELSRFNFEINSQPHLVNPRVLSGLQSELNALWQRASDGAKGLGMEVLMIGILPTLPEAWLNLENMSPLKRYRVLNEQVLRLRRGRPLQIDIQGRERLVSTHGDVMLEAAATSLQVHLQVDPARALRFYNAALIASAPVVGLSANSPYLFGKDLWDETRIPLFEQAVGLGEDPGHPSRVTFGDHYARDSLLECFLENVALYPVIIPLEMDENAAQLRHLRLHNGTIWRWNRPLVDPDAAGVPHLRIENRVMPAGPSLPDAIANIAAYLGLVHALANQEVPPERDIDFATARENFYRAARDGLHAEIAWLPGKKGSLLECWRQVLLPMAQAGLRQLGLDAQDISYYLDEIIAGRIASGRNGAVWQRHFVAGHGRDLQGLTAAYAEYQAKGRPVHEWKV